MKRFWISIRWNHFSAVFSAINTFCESGLLNSSSTRKPLHYLGSTRPTAKLLQVHCACSQRYTTWQPAPDPQGNPLERTGLNRYFERMFSVHDLRKFKPAPEAYRSVAESLGVEPAAICMIAAHTWDTLGAQAMGCSAALVTRSANASLPVEGVPQPEMVAADLALVADEIIKRWRS